MEEPSAELRALIRTFVAAEVAASHEQLREELLSLKKQLWAEIAEVKETFNQRSCTQLDEVKDIILQVRRREERADFVHVPDLNNFTREDVGSPIEGQICVQVGGQKFFTTAEVLRGHGHPDPSVRDSYLAAIVSGRWHSSLFIARSPESFAFILEYLTYYTLHNKPKDTAILGLLMQDADFYGLKGLHSELTVAINSLTCLGHQGGVRHWGHGSVQVTGLVDMNHKVCGEMGTKVMVHRPGLYMIAVRDQEAGRSWCRKLMLRKNEREDIVTSYVSVTTDGSVLSTQFVDLLHLCGGNTLSVHSDLPDAEALNSSMFMIRLDPQCCGTWRYKNGVFQHQCLVDGLGTCATSLDGSGNASERITIGQSGQYIVVASMLQMEAGQRSLTLLANGLVVAGSYVNAGNLGGRRSRATAFLMQLIDLSMGDHLHLESEHLHEDDDNRLLLVRLDHCVSSASWQATSHQHYLPTWGKLLLQHDDYFTADNDTKIKLVYTGCYLVIVRVVHGGNARKGLQLLQNDACIASCYTSTYRTHKNCGHIVEVVKANAGDAFWVRGDELEDEALYTVFSIICLHREHFAA